MLTNFKKGTDYFVMYLIDFTYIGTSATEKLVFSTRTKHVLITYTEVDESSEGLKIRGCQYHLVGIICPPWLS